MAFEILVQFRCDDCGEVIELGEESFPRLDDLPDPVRLVKRAGAEFAWAFDNPRTCGDCQKLDIGPIQEGG